MSRSRKTLEQQVSRLFLDLYLLEQRAKAIRRELSAAALQPVGDQVIVSIHESTVLAGVLLCSAHRRRQFTRAARARCDGGQGL